jgi:hypothetical protein
VARQPPRLAAEAERRGITTETLIDEVAARLDDPLEAFIGCAASGRTGTQVVTLPGGKSVTVEVIDDRGCLGRARRSIEGEDLGLFISMRREIESIGIQASDRALADPRVVAALQASTKCMTEQGFDVGSPSEAAELGSGLGGCRLQGGGFPDLDVSRGSKRLRATAS